jgi:lysophospholipase L1-like esterase
LYDRIKKERTIFLTLEEKYKNLAAEYGVEIIGSYDPRKVGCNADEFFDGMHPNDSCMQKVLSLSRRIAEKN